MANSTLSPVAPIRNLNGHSQAREGFTVDMLKRVPLLQGVSTEDIERARPAIGQRTLLPNEVLLTEDESGNTLFLLMEGAFKITVRKGEGTVLLALCGAGELLGELAAIDGYGRSATVTAQTRAVVGVVSADDFWNTLWPLSPITKNMAYLLVGRVRRLTAKVQAMATLDVRGRLAFQVASLVRDHAQLAADGSYLLPFGLTQAELAQMVGTSRVQVNQVMMTWGRHDILTAKRNSMIIHRLEALCQMYPSTLDTVASPPALA